MLTNYFAGPVQTSAYVPATPPNPARSCQHTSNNDPNPWWGVDLGAALQIDAIVMYPDALPLAANG